MYVEALLNVPVGILFHKLSGILLTSLITFCVIILNALSAVLVFAVALKVKFEVVSELTPESVPVIAPVEVLSDVPEGKEPD